MAARPTATRKELSVKEFKDSIQQKADELARWIDLSVDAFPTDPAAKRDRLARVRGADGFRFFLETYLPHYVKGDPSLFMRRCFVWRRKSLRLRKAPVSC
ncbi:hypothetical protein DFO80_106139 [Rhodobacter sp. 140A]|uniref:Uncharacterized protein n=1 Tax=bioreactor metagenome TaxID=1076179 RepID=A0A644U563_9ZZZZ|nr:hypothetical protein DFO80_106139 [Rhodobacter sp. 140A]